MKNTIRLIENESGDWKVLLLNGEVYEKGHDIPIHVWMNLIQDLGHKVSMDEVTDREMAYKLY